MFTRLARFGLFVGGAWLGILVAALAPMIVSGWFRIAVLYALVIFVLWLIMRLRIGFNVSSIPELRNSRESRRPFRA